MKIIRAFALIVLVAGSAAAAPISVHPAREEGFKQSLNGEWSFKYLPALDAGADTNFHTPSFDVSAWKTIPVPANWELHGFAEPQYALELKDGLENFSDCVAEIKKIGEEVWGDCDGRSAKEHRFGKEKDIWGKPLPPSGLFRLCETGKHSYQQAMNWLSLQL